MDKSSELKIEILRFGETVSVRGVPRIFKSNVRFLQIFWLIAVLASSAILVWQLSTVVIKYLGCPVTTTISNTKDLPPFPDVTICNLYPVGETINKQLTWKTYLEKVKAAKESISMESMRNVIPNITQYGYDYMMENLESPAIYFTNFPVYAGTTNNGTLPGILSDCRYFSWDSNKSTVSCQDSLKSISNARFYKCHTLHLKRHFCPEDSLAVDDFVHQQFPGSGRRFHVHRREPGKCSRDKVDSPQSRNQTNLWRWNRRWTWNGDNVQAASGGTNSAGEHLTALKGARVRHFLTVPPICTQPTPASRYASRIRLWINAVACPTTTNTARPLSRGRMAQNAGT